MGYPEEHWFETFLLVNFFIGYLFLMWVGLSRLVSSVWKKRKKPKPKPEAFHCRLCRAEMDSKKTIDNAAKSFALLIDRMYDMSRKDRYECLMVDMYCDLCRERARTLDDD